MGVAAVAIAGGAGIRRPPRGTALEATDGAALEMMDDPGENGAMRKPEYVLCTSNTLLADLVGVVGL